MDIAEVVERARTSVAVQRPQRLSTRIKESVAVSLVF
jgi:hypothetical protein